MQRFKQVDIAKGIAIILVVVGHYYPQNSPQWFATIHDLIYSFHMPLFMGLSGYLFSVTYSNDPFFDFVSKKFRRLMIPYFFISVLILFVKLITQKITSLENSVDILGFVKIFYYPEAGFYLWYIYTLFLIFLFVPLFRSNIKFLFFISLLIFFVPDIPDIFYLNKLKSMLIYFVIGMTFSSIPFVKTMERGYIRYITIIISLFLMFLSLHFKEQIDNRALQLLLSLTGGISGSFLVLFLANFISSKNLADGMFIKLGIYSSVIYFFHTICMGPVKTVLNKMPIPGTQLTFIVIASLVTLSGIILPVLIAKYFIKRNRIISALTLGENR